MPRGRRDANERPIIDALRGIGASVQQLEDADREGLPDLLVGFCGVNYLLEVKTERGRLKSGQARWHGAWDGDVRVARSVEAALAVVGVRAATIPRATRRVAQSDGR